MAGYQVKYGSFLPVSEAIERLWLDLFCCFQLRSINKIMLTNALHKNRTCTLTNMK